jgi:hypothetical protein
MPSCPERKFAGFWNRNKTSAQFVCNRRRDKEASGPGTNHLLNARIQKWIGQRGHSLPKCPPVRQQGCYVVECYPRHRKVTDAPDHAVEAAWILHCFRVSWFEPMPGSHTFCFSVLQALFRSVVPILYNTSLLVNICCNCTYSSGHGVENRIYAENDLAVHSCWLAWLVTGTPARRIARRLIVQRSCKIIVSLALGQINVTIKYALTRTEIVRSYLRSLATSRKSLATFASRPTPSHRDGASPPVNPCQLAGLRAVTIQAAPSIITDRSPGRSAKKARTAAEARARMSSG